MSLLIESILFITFLIILIKGADYFVESASKIAKRIGVSEFIIGITLVSVGTSLPELGAAVSASISKNSSLILGNIVGSNIANIALVLGIGMLYNQINKKYSSQMKKSAVYLVIVTSLFFILSFFGTYNRIIAVLFLSMFSMIIYLLKDQKGLLDQEVDEVVEDKRIKMPFEIVKFILSGILIFLGAKFLIPSAMNIAALLGVNEVIVGLFAIAVGTSLPELVVTISSVRKKKIDLLLGNIIGSNIANLLLIGGISSLIYPITIDKISFYFTIPMMLFVTLIISFFIKRDVKFRVYHGIALIILYVIFIISSFFVQNMI